MHVFVTGATGFVGSAVVKELIGAGHTVLGLARTEAGAAALKAAGAEVYMGNLDDPETLRSGASLADGVIHTAFNHDFSKFKDNCETDRRVIEAMADALAGSDRPFIITSGTGILTSGELTTEADAQPSGPNASPRVASEEAAMAAAGRGVYAAVVRLPPSVHGEGDHGFVPMLIDIARQKAKAAYVAAGANTWPAVHRLDAARLYRLALEKAAAGVRYHAVAEEGIPFRNIAEMIGRGLHVPVASLAKEDAAEYFGWFAYFAGINNRASSRQTRAQLGWEPVHPGLLADLEGTMYFGK